MMRVYIGKIAESKVWKVFFYFGLRTIFMEKKVEKIFFAYSDVSDNLKATFLLIF